MRSIPGNTRLLLPSMMPLTPHCMLWFFISALNLQLFLGSNIELRAINPFHTPIWIPKNNRKGIFSRISTAKQHMNVWNIKRRTTEDLHVQLIAVIYFPSRCSSWSFSGINYVRRFTIVKWLTLQESRRKALVSSWFTAYMRSNCRSAPASNMQDKFIKAHIRFQWLLTFLKQVDLTRD